MGSLVQILTDDNRGSFLDYWRAQCAILLYSYYTDWSLRVVWLDIRIEATTNPRGFNSHDILLCLRLG